VILEFLVQKSLYSELWLERYEDLKLGGLFCEFFWGYEPLWNNFSRTRGLATKFWTVGSYARSVGAFLQDF
jgi:hypothetical protein